MTDTGYHKDTKRRDTPSLLFCSFPESVLLCLCIDLILNHMEKDMSMMGDKLILRGLKFYGFHGAIPEEKTLGQMFMLDIDAWICLKKAGQSDNLEDSISYVDLYKLAKEVVEGSSRNLLEAVAELVASKTLETFPRITAIRVKLWKPNVPLIQSSIDCLGVEIFRNRNN